MLAASKTLTEPLAWQHPTLLQGDVAKAVHALKQEDGGDLHVIGSQLVQTLLAHDLVDEFRAMSTRCCWAAASGSSAVTVRAGRCGCLTAR
jgi:dihydrofolate reductase